MTTKMQKKRMDKMRKAMEVRLISTLVAKFPADQQPLESTVVDDGSRTRVFWTRQQTCSDDVAALRTSKLHLTLQRAFTQFQSAPLNGLLQFWAPAVDETGPSHLPLSTSQQPFSLDVLGNPRLVEYRLFSINHRLQHDPHAAVFRDPFSVAVLNLRTYAHKGRGPHPLVDKAIDCGLDTLLLLPVFCLYPPGSSCIGVVECCINTSDFHTVVQALQDLVLALKPVLLTTYPVQQSLPCEPTHGINLAKVEIEEALKIVCESLHLSLVQVWIDLDAVNQVSCSSPGFHNMEHEDHPEQPAGHYVVKFCGYVTGCKHPDNPYHAKLLDYYHTCDVLPFRKGKGLPGETLQTHEPRFCKDSSQLTVKWIPEVLCRMARCSSLAICLRSTHTGKCVDYVFEFYGLKTEETISPCWSLYS
uniref:protein NLP7-like n=1 Tax=Erigeron canadensis TaxID=72917 RepID=UPI001CB92F7E|nr:protein NLP7-like [Erigeron canadensis]